MGVIDNGKWSPGSIASVCSATSQGIVDLRKVWPRMVVAEVKKGSGVTGSRAIGDKAELG